MLKIYTSDIHKSTKMETSTADFSGGVRGLCRRLCRGLRRGLCHGLRCGLHCGLCCGLRCGLRRGPISGGVRRLRRGLNLISLQFVKSTTELAVNYTSFANISYECSKGILAWLFDHLGKNSLPRFFCTNVLSIVSVTTKKSFHSQSDWHNSLERFSFRHPEPPIAKT